MEISPSLVGVTMLVMEDSWSTPRVAPGIVTSFKSNVVPVFEREAVS